MQISVDVLTEPLKLNTVADDEGQYDIPRGLYLAYTGGLEAHNLILDHLRESGQVQPGDVVDTNWPAP
jgi:hypothetical protein